MQRQTKKKCMENNNYIKVFNIEKAERYLETYEDPISKKKGLRNSKTDEIIIDASANSYNSLIPSKRNCKIGLPVVATYNKYSDNNEIIRGVIDVSNGKEIKLPHTYNFIDGFDEGLARVYRIINREKKWGIVGIFKVDNTFEIRECVELGYDNIWNFYDKMRLTVPAFRDGVAHDLSLKKLREDIISFSETVESLEPQNAHIDDIEDEYRERDEQVSINSLSMTNFKRFAETTQIDLSSRITFIVGKNNSGKSTFLNAVELCFKNLYFLHFTEDGKPFFCFEPFKDFEVQNELYKKYRSFDSTESDPLILTMVSGDWEFIIHLNDSALISKITASNNTSGDKVTFSKGKTEVRYHNKTTYLYEADSWIVEMSGEDNGFDGFFRPILSHVSHFVFSRKPIDEKAEEVCKEIKSSIDIAITGNFGIERLRVFAPIGMESYRFFYLGIGNEVYFSETNFVGTSIRRYYDEIMIEDSQKRYHNFVCKWLQRMDIGVDFDIKKSKKDESYIIQIVQENGIKTDLCHMGSGSIHFTALCLYIMLFIKQNTDNEGKGSHYTPILLVEEPEQNLHPMLQSRLAEFFLDVSDFYAETYEEGSLGWKIGLKMIVETHSEYIIRKTQVLAKEFCKNGGEISDFAFRTYYFPSKNDRKTQPYDMKYCKDGRFYERFGFGFFDESSELAMQIF